MRRLVARWRQRKHRDRAITSQRRCDHLSFRSNPPNHGQDMTSKLPFFDFDILRNLFTRARPDHKTTSNATACQRGEGCECAWSEKMTFRHTHIHTHTHTHTHTKWLSTGYGSSDSKMQTRQESAIEVREYLMGDLNGAFFCASGMIAASYESSRKPCVHPKIDRLRLHGPARGGRIRC